MSRMRWTIAAALGALSIGAACRNGDLELVG